MPYPLPVNMRHTASFKNIVSPTAACTRPTAACTRHLSTTHPLSCVFWPAPSPILWPVSSALRPSPQDFEFFFTAGITPAAPEQQQEQPEFDTDTNPDGVHLRGAGAAGGPHGAGTNSSKALKAATDTADGGGGVTAEVREEGNGGEGLRGSVVGGRSLGRLAVGAVGAAGGAAGAGAGAGEAAQGAGGGVSVQGGR